MRVTFLTEGTLAPSSRFRVQQFLPHFEAAGISCQVIPGYGDAYNRIAATRWGAPYKVAARSRRLLGGLTAKNADVLFIQRPIFPFSAAPEALLQRINPRIVFDVDDAVFLGPDSLPSPRRRQTFDRCVSLASHYIAGNDYLAENGRHPAKTSVIPTVIDTDRYVPDANQRQSASTVIGWIGSPTTLRYIDQVLPALRAVRDRYPNVVVRIVCSHMPAHLADEQRFEFVPWSKEGEIAAIQSFDIGIMPMEDTAISLGKCGFKMIQYMAAGVAVVSSPIGANEAIFQGSNAGALARTQEDWIDALSALVEAPERRAQCGIDARTHAVRHYSIHAVLPRYLDLFDRVARANGQSVPSK